MKQRMIINDIKNNKLLSFSTWIFMAVSALLFSMTCFLSVNLLGSVDTLMETAKTPDFLQMHAGEIEEEELKRFAETNPDVAQMQVLTFLNLENGSITLGGHSLADSTQDNGVSVQSTGFDYLVDMENRIIRVTEGEIYVPACYGQEYELLAGDTVQINDETFRIAGFLRDSQMNSMMASSKRFLVNATDYEKLKASGSEEYLIEFLLMEGADVNAFAAEYVDAGLPMNGPAITKPLIRMINALSDGMVVLVILMASVVMLLISMLCIRFTLLARLKQERREIGMLKAIGVAKKELRQIYFLRYLILSTAGAAMGLLAAYFGKQPLQAEIQKLYGPAQNGLVSFMAAAAAAAVTEGVLLLSVRHTLRQAEKLTVIEALTDRSENKKPGKQMLSQQLLVAFVIAAGVFLMTVPQNLYSTISDPEFVTYMGIGNGEIRLDIRQTEEIEAQTSQAEKILSDDKRVEKSVSLLTKSYRAALPDGSYSKLNVEQGDHLAFPVSYLSGRAPQSEGQIAISDLYAEEAGLGTGDSLYLTVGGMEQKFTVCGLYSDITNGGKTAKTIWIEDDAPVMWSVLYVSLTESTKQEQWISEYEEKFSGAGMNVKIVNITDYVQATYGQTMRQIRQASWVALLAAVLVTVTVVFLFIRLLLAAERKEISLKKALGLTGKQIGIRYCVKYLMLAGAGILSGILLGNLLGERIAGILLSSLGASGVHFIINGAVVYGGIPALAFLAVAAAVLLGLYQIRFIRAYECCTAGE